MSCGKPAGHHTIVPCNPFGRLELGMTDIAYDIKCEILDKEVNAI